jgi:hypothetical protein
MAMDERRQAALVPGSRRQMEKGRGGADGQ